MTIRNVPGTYPTFAAAIAASVAGDTIVVAANYAIYSSSLNVSVDNLTFQIAQGAEYQGFKAGAGVRSITVTGNSSGNIGGNELANVLRGNNARSSLAGYDGDDRLFGNGENDYLVGGAGNDRLDGGAGVDSTSYRDALTGVTVDLLVGTASDGRGGTDTLISVENLYGSRFADNLILGNTSGEASGDAGDDTIQGGAGDDNIVGGSGNDVLSGDAGIDTIIYLDQLQDSGGATRSGVTVSLLAGRATDNWRNIDILAGFENVVGSYYNDALVGDGGDNVLSGSNGKDTLNGGAGADTLYGDQMDDMLKGGDGDDRLDGGSGNDRIDGGAGIDTVDYLVQGNDTWLFPDQHGVTVDLQAGTATDAMGGTDTLVAIENVVGFVFNDTLSGNAAANRLDGQAGNDRIDGRAGADTMLGGAGDDRYVVDNAGDQVIEAKNQGTDLVTSSVSFTLADNVENLTLTGTAAIDGAGNALANLLNGNSGANRLDGKAGADTMKGGAGNDTYVVDNAGDQVIDSGGKDLVISTISYTLGDGVDNLTLGGGKALSGAGNALANIMVGNASTNRLDGQGGRDTLTGGAGRDTFAFTTAPDIDTITDFVSGIDHIELSGAIFSALDPGVLSAAAFVQATSAATADQHILYNKTNGVVFYDADGNGVGSPVAFARLTPGQTLKAGDFTVV